MDIQSCQLTVYFEAPFWVVGIFEKREGAKLFVYKHTFGSEPKDYEILALINTKFEQFKFSDRYAEVKSLRKKVSYKKMQKKIKQSITNRNGTKAQQIIQAQKEQNKLVRKKQSKAERERMKQEKFALKQAKRKRKQRGH